MKASQFSREYSRFFGSSLMKDIAGLRQESRPLGFAQLGVTA